MIIYKATNTVDGKCYIGQTKNTLKFRKRQHIISKINTYFSKAINKYGKENFIWEVLCECKSKEELDEMEFHYIKQYNSFGVCGYNLAWGGSGGGMTGHHHTKETKQKISDATKGDSNPFYGKTHSDEIKKILSEKMSGSNHIKSRTYKVITPTGEVIIVSGIRKWCREHKSKLLHQLMIKVAKNIQTHHKGYKCEYINE
jgi:group I intron endonuclease